jgi:peroxiredoxin Q/BCP
MAQLGRPKRLAVTLALFALVAAAGSAALFLVFAGPVKRPDGGSGLLAVGAAAPDFEGHQADGTRARLSDKSGQLRVVYFYPKDETPGCTKEACSFRDAWAPLAKTGAVLVGVSADSLDSHKAFVAHWKLPFLLITDADGSIGKKYGVPFESYHQRQTIVIGADGKVRKVYRKVDVSKHAQEILADLSPTSPTSAN